MDASSRVSPSINVETIRSKLIDQRNVLRIVIETIHDIRRGVQDKPPNATEQNISGGMEGIAELTEQNRCLLSEVQNALSPLVDKPSLS